MERVDGQTEKERDRESVGYHDIRKKKKTDIEKLAKIGREKETDRQTETEKDRQTNR